MTQTPPPSFVRRHPLLAAFGALAGLSLFAAYWPISAVITGIVVAGRATGADQVAWRWLRTTSTRVAGRVRAAWREHEARRSGVAPGHHPAMPTEPSPAPPAAPAPSPRTTHLRAPLRRGPRHRRVATSERSVPALDQRELGE
jgi:hypothetical protein